MMLAERNRSITLVMRRWWFERVLMLPLVLVLSLGGLAAAVKVELEGERPEVGGNRFRITLTGEDASVGAEAGSSAPDSAAVPQVLASMPAMGAMPYMETTGTVERLGAGTFRAEVELTMGGTWDITVTLPARPGAAARTFRYAVTTDVAGVVDKNAPDVAGSATLPTTGSAAQGGRSRPIL